MTLLQSVQRLSVFDSLHNRDFRWFWLARLAHSASMKMGNVAQGWLVYQLTGSALALGGDPTQIGFVSALRPLAGLLVFPLAGYLTDHVDRVKLIAFGGYLSGTVVLMYVLAPNWQIVALASLLQGFMVLQFPPESALIADSLLPEDRGKGVATMTTLAGALAIVSPYLAGVIIDAYGEEFGIRVLYGVMMVVYLAGAAINHRYLKETATTAKSAFDWSALPRAFRDAYGGVLSLLKKLPRSLRAQAAIVILGLTCNAIASSFWVVYAKDVFGGGPDALGTLLSAVGIGGILGGFVTASLGKLERRGLIQMGSLLLLSLSFIGFAASSAFWVAIGAIALAGFFEMIYLTTNQTLLQLSIPDELRGRVTSIVSLRSGLTPVGAFIAGIGADLVGPRTMTLIFGGIIGAIAVIVYLASPIVREYRLSQAVEGAETKCSA
jgi:MFS family permease